MAGGRRRDPCWEHATEIPDPNNPNKRKWRCNHCESDFAGGASRIKLHLGLETGEGIKPCKKYKRGQVADEALEQGNTSAGPYPLVADLGSTLAALETNTIQRTSPPRHLEPRDPHSICNQPISSAVIVHLLETNMQTLNFGDQNAMIQGDTEANLETSLHVDMMQGYVETGLAASTSDAGSVPVLTVTQPYTPPPINDQPRSKGDIPGKNIIPEQHNHSGPMHIDTEANSSSIGAIPSVQLYVRDEVDGAITSDIQSLGESTFLFFQDQPSLAGSRSNGPLVGNANRAPMGPEPGNPHGISNYSESNHNTLPSLGQSNPINVSPQVATTTSNAQGFTNDLSSRIDSNISNHRVNSMIRELQEEVRPNALSHAGLNVPPTNTGDIHENMMLEHNDPMQVEREFVNARESPQPSSSSSSIAMESRRREIFELAPHTVGRDHIVDEICHSLMDQILCIGVYGMGGVGKTTIMKRLDDKVRGDAAFGKVLWVTVSQDCSLHELQNKLSMALKVTDDFRTIDIVERPTFLNGHLRERGKTLIILDDLWQHYNLNELGIKLTRDGGIQLVLTTRHQDVCQRMMCEKEFEVKCLPDDDAMNLFEKTLGYEMSDSRKGIAKDIIGKCRGLPLAIVVIAAHMRGVDSDHGWHSTLERLRHPEEVEAQHFMVKEVFPILHHSYKELNGRQQQCFLLCALYPEDWEIRRHQLIELYIDEGVIREDSRWKMYNEANHMLDELEKKCLLEKVVDDGPLETDEQGEVRMHDVIRDLALHIMNSKGTCIVKCHIPLDEIPVMDDGSRDLQKVSLVRNSFMKELPSLQSNCPKLSTLLVSGCYKLSEIPECFFERAEGLKVVDISSTDIATVPGSIIKLKILNALILRGCRKLLSVPSLATLTSLRKLDLRRCKLIDAVPEGLEMLVNLTYLDLSWTSIEEIKAGVVGKLQKLQHLGLGCVAVHGKEVATLKKLEIMSCRFKEMNELSDYMQHRQHESTLKAYALLIGDDNNTNWNYCINTATGVDIWEDNFHWRWDMKAVILERVNFAGETLHIPSDVKTLHIDTCEELKSIESISNWPHIRSFIHELRIERCPKLKRIPFLDGFPIAPPFLEKLLIDSYEQWESMEWEHPQAKHALEPYVFIVSKFNDEIPTWEWRLLQIL